MKTMKIIEISSLFLLISSLLLFGCGKEKLKELDKYQLIKNQLVSAEVDFCTIKADKIKSNLKFIFVVDKSGSNQDIPSKSKLGTDTDGSRRYVPLQTYLDASDSDQTTFYSLINFSTNSKLVVGFTNDKEEFENVIEQENPNGAETPDPSDGGWTNFSRALKEISDLIANDIAEAKKQPKVVSSFYVVIFISDGAPYIGTDTLQKKQDILDQVKGLTAFEEGNREYVDSVQLHTAYYYNDEVDSEAQIYMQEMAKVGNGDSFEFGSGQVIDFSQFSVPERKVKHLLRDIIVTNVSTKWHGDQLQMDTDGDGLVDELEDTLGSNKYWADSDGNGISDGVEYYISERPCRDPNCAPQNSEPYIACNKWEVPDEETDSETSDDDSVDEDVSDEEISNSEVPDDDGFKPWLPEKPPVVRKLTDLDKDFLNDCEEQIVLKSKIESFDSNEDWIPDGLAFRRSMAFVEGTNQESLLDPDWDGANNYSEVKTNTPMQYDNNKIYGIKPYRYKIETVKEDSAQTCFHLKVDQIPAKTEHDLIRVYIMENTSVINNKRFFRTAEKRLRPGVTNVKFKDDDFTN